MDDINWMISILSEFLAEEKEELVFLDLWDKTPDIVPFEEVFHAQLEFQNERQATYVNIYGGDPRAGNVKNICFSINLNHVNAVAFRRLCADEGIKPTTKIRQLIHGYLLEKNIRPFHVKRKKKYYEHCEPVMVTRPFDFEKAHLTQFEDKVVDPEKDIECDVKHHPTQRQNRWYWRRNTKRYW